MRTRFQSLLTRAARPTEPDADLLRRFADGRDEAAFAELVRRYGRLVWGQCRNLLPTEADADDAFQATFVVLAESAAKVRDANKLGPWLCGVAYRVCKNARRVSARRGKRERGSATPEASRPVADSTWDSALAAVLDELHGLPETLRVPFILCCLEGKGTTEAAEQLGLKLGTFSARLTRAKQALLDRLSARGITASVVALATITGAAAAAPVKTASQAVTLAVTGSVPANILSLTHGVLGMTILNGKLLAAAVLVSCGLAIGFGGVFTANAQEPKKVAQDARDKELQELRRLVDEQRARAEQAKDAEMAARKQAETLAREVEKEFAEQIRAAEDTKKAPALKEKVAPPEFKYFGQSANFAPTAQELETLVKRGEEGGYKFVGITNMKGMTKQGDGAVPTLVFRRDAMNAKWAAEAVYDKAWKAQTEAASALEKVAKAKDQVKEKLSEVTGDKAKEAVRKVEEEVQKALKAEQMAKEKTKELPKLPKVTEAAKEKLKELPKVSDTAKEKLAEAVDKQLIEKKLLAADEAKLKAEMDLLRAKIAELEGKTAKKPAEMTVKFNRADLGKGDAATHTKFLMDLAARKFDKPRVEITLDPRDNTIVVQGDPEVVKWLQDAVKVLGTSGKPAK